MGRLTEHMDYCFLACYEQQGDKIREECPIYYNCYSRQMHEKLSHYEDLEEQGRLIVRKHERCEYCSDGETLKGQRIMVTNYGWQDINYCPNCGAKMDEVGNE